MRLKMDKNGNVYETDSRYNDERGVNRSVPMVKEENLMSLSVKADPDAVKDKKKMNALVAQENKLKADAIKAQKKTMKHALFALHSKMDKLFKNQTATQNILHKKKNYYLEKAICQDSYDFEQMGGVSGNAYTSDGRKPYIDFPSRDHKYIDDVPEAYGEIGKATAPVLEKATTVKILPYTPTVIKPAIPPMYSPPFIAEGIPKPVAYDPAKDPSLVKKAKPQIKKGLSSFSHPMLLKGLIPQRK